MHAELLEKLEAIAQVPLLLVASDYDGTLAEFTLDPAQAVADQPALHALDELRKLPWTYTAVVSGRSHADLTKLLADSLPTYLVGSHGCERRGPGVSLSRDQRELLSRVVDVVIGLAANNDGVRCEVKPAGVALHTRGASPLVARRVIASALETCADLPGVLTRHGQHVLEFMVVPANKGDAIKALRHACGATNVVFVGDDITDEDVFRTLGTGDVSVKVRSGQTSARHQIESLDAVAQVLSVLAQRRREWIQRRRITPLNRCAVLSDQRTMAVVAPGARVSWMCLPRVDSGALFSELVGGDGGGVFSIAPVDAKEPEALSYIPDSFTFQTAWNGLRVTDYLDCAGGRAIQKAGHSDLIRVIEGTAPTRIRFAPRLDYGRVPTQLRIQDDGLHVEGSPEPIVLRAPGVRWTIVNEGVHQSAEAIVDPTQGAIVLELRYGSASLEPALDHEGERREQNRLIWASWAATLKLPSRHPELVKRSALVLKALCYGPTGASVAAATTSLPEQLGGVRNWDYRYCWPRDAARAAASLVRLGDSVHAVRFLDWLLEVADRCESPDRLHPIYTVSGTELPPEAELGELPGFAQSRPVRLSNAAASQVQLDVFGPIVNLVTMLGERGVAISAEHWRLVRAMVRAVELRWKDPDHGIWEMRLERRHHVHSKVMCWHTVDRALKLEQIRAGTQSPEWLALRQAIRDDVLACGWSPIVHAFTGAYEREYADAAVLELGITGLVPASDERWASTVEFIARELRDGPAVRRYKTDDGLPGEEGTMLICTGWLIEALASIGRRDEAERLLEQFAGLFAGPGILSEQFDVKHSMALGNIAQAYSHLAFIDAAVALDHV